MIDRLQASWSLLGLQRMATALFATLDPATGQLRIASAGHLPPLLLHRRARGVPAGGAQPDARRPAGAGAGAGVGRRAAGRGDAGAVHRRAGGEPHAPTSTPGWPALLAAARPAGDVRPGRAVRPAARPTWPAAHRADDIALLALTRDP